jgi:hypothetical protein
MKNPADNPGPSLMTSVTAPRGSSLIVQPDVLVTLRNNIRIHLFELKRAISRKRTSPTGFPLDTQAKAAIVKSLNRAMRQVENQAHIYFRSIKPWLRPNRIMLVAAAGPWFSYRIMEDTESLWVTESVEDLAAAAGGRDDDDDDDPPASSSLGEGLQEGTFELNEYTNYLDSKWSPPFLLGSQRGEDEMRVIMSFALMFDSEMRYV